MPGGGGRRPEGLRHLPVRTLGRAPRSGIGAAGTPPGELTGRTGAVDGGQAARRARRQAGAEVFAGAGPQVRSAYLVISEVHRGQRPADISPCGPVLIVQAAGCQRGPAAAAAASCPAARSVSAVGQDWRWPPWSHHRTSPLVHTVSPAVTEITANSSQAGGETRARPRAASSPARAAPMPAGAAPAPPPRAGRASPARRAPPL